MLPTESTSVQLTEPGKMLTSTPMIRCQVIEYNGLFLIVTLLRSLQRWIIRPEEKSPDDAIARRARNALRQCST
jgi:hypothetical protein